MTTDDTLVLPGGAGLVGQNLVARLKAQGYRKLVVLDKHRSNLAVLQRMHPDVVTRCVDLADPAAIDQWAPLLKGARAVVMLQAQIGGNDWQDFVRNNIDTTRHVLDAMRAHGVRQLVHISSSVVQSVADDFYTRSKRQQEQMVLAALGTDLQGPVLRPTLMFGWFDRKHLGWLARFMHQVPVFPIPGHGRYMRQPLYVGDFCNIIISCLQQPRAGGVFDISGQEKVDYIDIIRHIKRVTGARSAIVRIPYGLFHALLWAWGLFDRNPPFTTQQLAALTARDEFVVIDWPGLFGVPCTPFAQAIDETFNHPLYSGVKLEF